MNKDTEKIAVICEKVNKIEAWIDNADKNHFPTIERRFDSIERKLAYYSGGIIVAVWVIEKFLL